MRKEVPCLRPGVDPRSALEMRHYVGSSIAVTSGAKQTHQHLREGSKVGKETEINHYNFSRREGVVMNFHVGALSACPGLSPNDPDVVSSDVVILLEGLTLTDLGSYKEGPSGYNDYHPKISYDFNRWLRQVLHLPDLVGGLNKA